MARQFTEAEIDFDGVAGDLSRLVPPKVTLEEILGRLREVMLERKDKGVNGEADGQGAGQARHQRVRTFSFSVSGVVAFGKS